MPTRETSKGRIPAMFFSLKRISPRRGGLKPIIERMVVVLPMPFRPSRATTCPSLTSRLTPCRA